MKSWSGLLLCAALFLGGCAAADRPVPEPALSAPAGPRDADPALWLLADDDTSIYLFGTVHFLPPGLGWFDEAIRDAFDASDTLVLEMIAPPEAELAALTLEYGIARDGVALRDRLTPDSRMQYEALMQDLGLPPAQFDGFKPWLAFMSLYQMLLQQSGFDSTLGVEQALTLAAGQGAKPVDQLESAREQLALFDALTVEEQLALLQSLLDDPDAVDEQVEEIVGHWAAGDIKGLGRYLKSLAVDTPANRALIATRNAHWTDWLVGRLDEPGTVFVAVGAAHLAGPDNVRDMLTKRGFTVRRVEY